MDRKALMVLFLAVSLFASMPAHAFLGLFEDDDAKEEKYKGETDRMRIELQRLQFETLMEQNRELMAENRSLYQRSMRNLSAMGGPGLVYAVLAVGLGIILLLVFLLFKLASGNRKPQRRTPYHPPEYRVNGPTVGRLVDDEQREIENQFKLLEG
jgi:formate-dependent nitrite reductase membrane component NrfD